MGKKTYLYLLGLLGFTSLAAAQIGPSTGNIGQVLVNILGPIFQRYFGIPLDQTNALSTLAVATLFWFGIYIGLEAFLRKVGWYESFIGGYSRGGGSRRRLIGFSFLLFLVMLGSQAFTPLILILRDSLILTLFLGAFFAVIAGLKGVYWGGRSISAQAGAKTKKSLAKSQKEEQEAEEQLKDIGDKAKDIGKKAKEIAGMEDEVETLLREEDVADAAQEIEVIIKKMEALENEAESAEQDLKQVLNELESMMQGEYQVEKEIESKLESHLSVLEAVRQDIENQSLGNHPDRSGRPAVSKTGFDKLMDGLEDVHQALQEEEGLQPIIVKGVQLEREIEEVEELLDDDLKFMRGDVKDLTNLEAKANDLASQMRDREDFEKIQQEIQGSQAMERRFSDLLNALKSLEEETEEAKDKLSRLQKSDKSHGKLVNQVRKELDVIRQEINNNPAAIQSGFGIGNDDLRTLIERISSIEDELDQVEQEIARGYGP